jgi:hypothetical protein
MICLFSHWTLALPSVLSFQRVQWAEWSPAPAFCTMLAVTTYLKGFPRAASFFRQASTMPELQPLTCRTGQDSYLSWHSPKAKETFSQLSRAAAGEPVLWKKHLAVYGAAA